MAIYHPISIAKQIAQNNAKIRRMESTVKWAKQTSKNLDARSRNLGEASRAANTKVANFGKAAAVGKAVGYSSIGTAAAIGAGAIGYQVYKLNKEIKAQNQSSQRAYDMGIKLIKAKRKK